MGIERQKMKDEDFAKMILGMMEAREKERMLGIRVLIIAHNAYKFQGCAQIYRNYLPQHIAIHVRKQYLAELNRKERVDEMRRAIAIDFDGCICQSKYPEIGEPNWHVIEEAKKEQEAGAGLILWTCRAGKELDAAIAACKEWGLNFDTVNQSLPEWIEAWGSDSRKVGADEYWDDKAVIADTTCILRSATCYQRKNK